MTKQSSGTLFDHKSVQPFLKTTMENISMPSDHENVFFTDQNGTRHEGFYRKVLKAFVDTENGKDPEDINNIYLEDKIVDWKYVNKGKDPDSDIMVIL